LPRDGREERREPPADDLRRRPPDRGAARPVALISVAELAPKIGGLAAGEQKAPQDRAERLWHERRPGEHRDRLRCDGRLLRGEAALLDRERGDVTCREDPVDARDRAMVVHPDEAIVGLRDAPDPTALEA